MADDTLLNPGIGGDLIVTDSLGGVPERKVQAVKVMLGASGVEGALVDASNPLPVTGTVAATLSEPISVDDNGGSLTVDVGTALPTGDNNIGNVDIVTVPAPLSTTGNGAAATALRVTLASDSTGIVAATVSQATAANLNAEVQGDAAHDSPVSGNPVLVGGSASSTAPANVTAGDAVRLWAQLNGALCTELTAAGARIGGDATNGLDVDVTRVPSPLSTAGNGTAATAHRVTLASDSTVCATEDAVAAGDPTGVQMMIRVRSAPTVEVSTSGDHAALSGPVEGGVWTALIGDGIPAERIGGTTANGLDVDVTRLPALPAGTNNIGDVDVLSVPAPLSTAGNGTAAAALRVTIASDTTGLVAVKNEVGGTLDVSDGGGSLTVDGSVTATGAAAHDSAVSGNPVLVGLEARTSNPTAVSNGDAVRAQADTTGRQVTLVGSTPDQRGWGRVTLTNTSASDVLATPGAGVRWVVTSIAITNASGTVGTKVEVRDGTTVILQPQAEENGGGLTLSNPSGLFHGTANTAITARCATTGSDVDVFLAGYKEPG